jgi:beta propeller repeat protein
MGARPMPAVANRGLLYGLALIVLLATCCGTVTAGAEIAPGITTSGISNHTAIIWRSAQIDGDRIVWAEHISNTGFVYNIYLYNITTGKETLVSPSANDGMEQDTYTMDEHPVAISGNRVIWIEDMGIRMYDITTGKRSTIIENSDDFKSHLTFHYPGISADTIVWTEQRVAGESHTPDIIAYNLTTGQKILISHGMWDKTGIRIAGSRIIWEDYRKGGVDRDIYLYDLTTGQERVICNASGTQYDPKISGDRIVWDDHRDGNWDVYMYDLKTGTESAIATGVNEQEASDISGDRIIWMEWPSQLLYRSNTDDETSRLMMYDLSTGKEYRVLENIPGMFGPAISGIRIIWMDLAHIGPENRYIRRENTVQEISMFTLDPKVFPSTQLLTVVPAITNQPAVDVTPIPPTTQPVPGFSSITAGITMSVIVFVVHSRKRIS